MKFNEKGLIPAVIQDADSKEVLMLGYMNQESFDLTMQTKKITFYSRSKKRIWVKGETSKNHLNLVSYELDCDEDTLLFKVRPEGPCCHNGTITCWGNPEPSIIDYLEEVIRLKKDGLDDSSYVTSLFKKGINKIAQKVGEEAVEVVIEAKDDNRDLFLNESADLMFHLLVLLAAKGCSFNDIEQILNTRKKT